MTDEITADDMPPRAVGSEGGEETTIPPNPPPLPPRHTGYTVGDIIDGMKRAVEYVISEGDQRALRSLTETTWTQLGVGAMLGTLRHEP